MDPTPRPLRLSEHAEFTYLVRDVHELYRRSSAGGSKTIRSHQRRVRETLSRIYESDPEIRRPERAEKQIGRASCRERVFPVV